MRETEELFSDDICHELNALCEQISDLNAYIENTRKEEEDQDEAIGDLQMSAILGQKSLYYPRSISENDEKVRLEINYSSKLLARLDTNLSEAMQDFQKIEAKTNELIAITLSKILGIIVRRYDGRKGDPDWEETLAYVFEKFISALMSVRHSKVVHNGKSGDRGADTIINDLCLYSLRSPGKGSLLITTEQDDEIEPASFEFRPLESSNELLSNIYPLRKPKNYKGIVQTKRGDSYLGSLTSFRCFLLKMLSYG
jgi:hypothetical protein